MAVDPERVPDAEPKPYAPGPSRREVVLGALAAFACPAEREPASRARVYGHEHPAIPPADAAPLAAMPAVPAECPPLFPSFFLGGFEAAAHLRAGRHLDLTGATRHDVFAAADYERLLTVGIRGCRDGVSWPLSETPRGFDFGRALAMARAANRVGVRVVWGLMHYGWPLDLDVYSTAFPPRFARYARAFVRRMVEEGLADDLMVVPVNEPSFLAWAGGDVALLNPFRREHSTDLKYQLVRAAIEAIHAMRAVLPGLKVLHTDPLMNVAPRGGTANEVDSAEDLRRYQFQALNMMFGRTWGPQLGGSPDLIDVVGVNYYRNNQRYVDGAFIEGTDPKYRPLSDMLVEVWDRFGKPMIIAETGAEGDDRARWLRYVCGEAGKAIRAGCPLHAITWYPILNHPGWVDDRHIHNGLWDYAGPDGSRVRHEPLADVIRSTQPRLTALRDRWVLQAPCSR